MTTTYAVSAIMTDSERLGKPVHGSPGLAHEEQCDRDGGARCRAHLHVDTRERVEPEPGAGNVADVEREAA